MVSKGAVFDPAEAVTPFVAGQYRVDRFGVAGWEKESTWTIQVDGNSYFVADKNGRNTFRLFELDTQTYIVEAKKSDEQRVYGILRMLNGSPVVHFIDCDNYSKSDVAKKYPPSGRSEGFLPSCEFNSNEQLFGAIRDFVGRAERQYRFIPLADDSPAEPSAGEPLRKPDLVTLNLCNKSPRDIDAIVYHQHRDDLAKYMLSGWYRLTGGQCRDVAQFPKPGLSVFAATPEGDGRLEWQGTSNAYCVSPRQVHRVVMAGEKCIAGEAAKRFAAVSLTGSSANYTFEWNVGQK